MFKNVDGYDFFSLASIGKMTKKLVNDDDNKNDVGIVKTT